MAKVPYIPLYIGDWEQDTNCLSPLAEFALLKLTFKLFKSEKRGVFITNFNTLSILFKSDLDKTKIIFNELFENNILNFEFIEGDKIQIISRRMIREGNLSEIRSESGSLGGRGNKANKKQSKSKVKAKRQQITEYEYDNDIDNIVKLLNEKTGKKLSPKAKSAKANITARLKEGYQVSDFKTVIENKCEDWLSDIKMVKFLNPDTLFGNKFDTYLNQKPQTLFSTPDSPVMTDEEYEEYVRPKARQS